MAIEFRCPSCQKLLRVGDDAVGKQAKCPACGTVTMVPQSLAETLPPPLPTPTENPFGRTGESPFGAGPSPIPMPPPAPLSDNPYAAPYSSGVTHDFEVRPSQVSVNGVFDAAWKAFQTNMGMCVLVYFVAWLLGQAVSWSGEGINFALRGAGADPFAAVGVEIVFLLAEILVAVFLASGHDLYFMKTAKGELVEFSLLFSGISIFGRRMLLLLMCVGVSVVLAVPPLAVAYAVEELGNDSDIAILAGLGTSVICFIPGMWILLTYGLSWMIVADQPLGAMEAIRLSRTLSKGNRLPIFAVWILGTLLAIAGVFACCVGVFFTAPLAQMAFVVLYLHAAGKPTPGQPSSTPRERALPGQMTM